MGEDLDFYVSYSVRVRDRFHFNYKCWKQCSVCGENADPLQFGYWYQEVLDDVGN
ncbi:MAG TPA: hypothetical protein VIL99_17195 [Ignavibacteria bacterium]